MRANQVTAPAQPVRQRGELDRGRRIVEQPVEPLVVGGGPEVELVADRLQLRAGVAVPAALELEDLAVEVVHAQDNDTARREVRSDG